LFTAGARANTPGGGVDWSQTFSVDGDSYIYPISSTITGGSVVANIAFKVADASSETTYTGGYGSWTMTWATPTLSVAVASLTGQTFLGSYSNTSYTVTTSGLTTIGNRVHSITATGGTVTSATANGTFNFTANIHKDNTGTTRTVTSNTVFTRPVAVTGTSYTANLSATSSSPSASFTYPSLWVFTASTSTVPTRASYVTGTTFQAGVSTLADQVKVLSGTINNPSASPQGLWFAVKSSASQPTIFQTGASSVLLSDTTVTSNTVNLEPDSPLSGYSAVSYNLYGITLQSGNTYVSIS
jgi:hypothetical protein